METLEDSPGSKSEALFVREPSCSTLKFNPITSKIIITQSDHSTLARDLGSIGSMASFVKTNPVRGSDSLLVEAKGRNSGSWITFALNPGLDLLRSTIQNNGIHLLVPDVLSVTQSELKLQKIGFHFPFQLFSSYMTVDASRGTSAQYKTLGKELARLHSKEFILLLLAYFQRSEELILGWGTTNSSA